MRKINTYEVLYMRKICHTKLGAFETLISRLGKNTFSFIKNEENISILFSRYLEK